MPTSLVLLALVLSSGVVERVLAVVNGRPVLHSEARTLAVVRGVSADAALELLIDEALMYEQASLTPQASVRDDDLAEARQELFEKRPELRSELTEKDVERLLARQSAILKYLEFRFRPQVRPSDEELQKAYAEEYGGRPDPPAFETVADELRERLARRQLGEKVEAWVKELRASADVRKVRPAAGASESPR
jgi:hypothetical protein